MNNRVNSSRELDNAFKAIITAGWNQKSDGHVDSPTGHFATVPISAAEMEELLEAVFGDDRPECTIEPGYYFARENTDGILSLYLFHSAFEMNSMFDHYQRNYAEWSAPDYVLHCTSCDDSLADAKEAFDHECALGTGLFIVREEGRDL